MSLDMKIEKSTDSQKSVSEELLDAYLKKAVELTQYKGPLTSNIALSKEAKKEEWQGIKPEDVQKRQETHAAVVKEAEEKTATKHKVAYALGANTKPSLLVERVCVLTSLPAFYAGMCSLGGLFPPEAGVVGAAIVAKTAVDGIFFSTEEKVSAFDNYVEVKHTQMALKKLAKNLEKQEAKEKETGKGVKAAVIAKAGFAR